MKVSVEIKKSDFWDFYRYAMNTLKSRSEESPGIGPFMAMVLIAVFVAAYVSVLKQLNIDIRFDVPLFILLICIACIALWLYLGRFARLAVPLKNGIILGKQQIEVSDEGICTSGKNYSAVVKWEAVVEIAESDSNYFIFFDITAGYIVPKRCFESANEEEEFREIVANNFAR